jgi:outer membrane protein TolC
MKWFRILLLLAACGLSARAEETNVTSGLNTNLPPVERKTFASLPVRLPEGMNSEERWLSLEDCIRVALQHNFNVQIGRLNPDIARYNLSGSYGVYDPTFSFSGAHDFSLSPGGIDAQGRPFLGTESDTDTLRSGLSGLLPWGTSYSLGGTVSDQTVTRPTFINGTNIVGFSTNRFLDNTGTNQVVLLSPKFNSFPSEVHFENTSASAGALTLTQPLLKNFWIDSARYTIFADKKQLQITEANFRDLLMSTVTQVETAYVRLIQADENILVQEKALDLAEQTLAENKKRVEVGAMAPLDEQQAESQAATSLAALLKAQSDAGTQERVVKSLLSDNYTNDWMKVTIKPLDKLLALPQHFDLQESWRKALAYGGSPVRLQQLRLALDQLNANIRLQRNQLFPELDVTGSYGYQGSGKEISDALNQIQNRTAPFWSVGGQLIVPLSQTVARNNFKAAKAARDQQILTVRFQEQNTLITIENDIATARIDYEAVQATHDARLYAEAALQAEQKKYENGKSTLFDILGLQEKLTSARSDEITALASYNVDLAALSYDEGSTFERHKLDLKVQ